MDKSLAPLIAIIALVILLTVIIINSDFSSPDSDKSEQSPLSPKVQLRPASDKDPFSTAYPSNPGGDSKLINIGETFGKSKTLLAEGKTREAEEMLRTLLVFDPKHSQALSLLGGILFYSNRYDEAEMIFRQQIILNPHNHLAYNRLGATLAKQKKYNEAIDNSSIALGMHPDSGEAHINLAGMYSMVGKNEKAMEHFNKAYKLLGYAILPLSYDEAFDNIRGSSEFQSVLSEAKQASEHRFKEEKEIPPPAKEPLFKSE